MESDKDRRLRKTFRYISQLAKEYADAVGGPLAASYLTPKDTRAKWAEVRANWKSMEPNERDFNLQEHLRTLEGRSTDELAARYLPEVPARLRSGVLHEIIYLLVENGIITQEERTAEGTYRRTLRARKTYQSDNGLGNRTPEQMSKHGKAGGKAARDQEKGIFGLSPERRKEISHDVGVNLLEEGRGIHGLSLEESIKYGQKAARARGYQLYTDEEAERIIMLAKDPKYSSPSGRGRDWEAISAELERERFPKRNPEAIRIYYGKISKPKT